MDYKNSGKQTYPLSTASKWLVPLAGSFFAFVLIWQFTQGSAWKNYSTENQEWDVDSAHQVVLNVALPDDQTQTALLQPKTIAESHALNQQPEHQSFTIKSGDNLAYYFQQAGVDPKALQEVLALRDAQHLKRIYPGQTLRIHANDQGRLQSFQFDIDPLTTLIVHRKANGLLMSYIEEKPIEKRVAFGGGRIVDSFFVAGKQANLDDALIMALANVFTYDIDFAQDIKPNDYFKVLFEEYYVNGVKVGNGPIVAAEFVNNGKNYQAIRYTDSNGQASYYSPAGQSLKKAFIRTPVQFTRISSHFNLHRHHPVLHTIRAHKGVDYAAPTGTPVKAAGSGKVAFVGKKGGYGNVITLQHGSKYTTVYGHLSRFAKNLKAGKIVKQGEIIGYVGSTGLASGPHLHFEFQVDGVHKNPLTVTMPQAEGISGSAKPKFLAYSKDLLQLMDKHQKVFIASNEF